MAEDLEDARFWLPADFLEDESCTDEEEDAHTRSDEDYRQQKGMSVSPQSTLYGMRTWSTSSSDGASQDSSPRPPALGGDAWDLPGVLPEEESPESESDPQPKHSSEVNHTAAAPLLQKKQGRVWGAAASSAGAARMPLGLNASAWPPLLQPPPQPQMGSGMTAVFLQPRGTKEAVGTGVFLPRNANSAAEAGKKPACSTVLLPARVVRALNGQGRSAGGADQDAIFLHNVNLLRKRGLLPQLSPVQPAPASTTAEHEIRLPPDWTY